MVRLSQVLTRRHCQPELMDDPVLDERRHRAALRGLARINAWSGSDRILWSALLPLVQVAGAPLRVLDVATGSGDVPLALWRRARRAGASMTVHGCDVSPRAVECATERAKSQEAPLHFFVCDAVADALPGNYDVLTCSLFLHHLEESQAEGLLVRMTRAARRMVIIQDLVRCRGGYWLARCGTRLLSASDVVHCDGPRSVESAFTLGEVAELARRVGLDRVTLSSHWPFRYRLVWRRE
jgi:SAM-dependent methyltransferase